MIDVLTDLMNTIKGLDLDIIKVEGNDKSVSFKSMNTEGTIILKAETKEPVPEFEGVFGMSNLNILKGYLNIYNSYDESTDVQIKVGHKDQNGQKVFSDLKFMAKGKSSATYRLTGENALNRILVMKEMNWDVSAPSLSKKTIHEFSQFATVLGKTESQFSAISEDSALMFSIGDEETSTSMAKINMGDVEGSLKSSFSYPIAEFITVLNKENPAVHFSDHGIAMIKLETDLAKYEIVFRGAE